VQRLTSAAERAESKSHAVRADRFDWRIPRKRAYEAGIAPRYDPRSRGRGGGRGVSGDRGTDDGNDGRNARVHLVKRLAGALTELDNARRRIFADGSCAVKRARKRRRARTEPMLNFERDHRLSLGRSLEITSPAKFQSALSMPRAKGRDDCAAAFARMYSWHVFIAKYLDARGGPRRISIG